MTKEIRRSVERLQVSRKPVLPFWMGFFLLKIKIFQCKPQHLLHLRNYICPETPVSLSYVDIVALRPAGQPPRKAVFTSVDSGILCSPFFALSLSSLISQAE
eukprot:TRINITY_DN2873_c0_g3_i1.p1 TRINITY_DN2873_c0_g3~~TRINITY_DN2873_c0_g3_i1.p1  ORF type:complete len:102 (+),score=6.09 TRINITY_DN2873_c0_g3_i1:310-615(+)